MRETNRQTERERETGERYRALEKEREVKDIGDLIEKERQTNKERGACT